MQPDQNQPQQPSSPIPPTNLPPQNSADLQQPVNPAPQPVDPSQQPQPQMVYMSRPINPEAPVITEEAKAKHEEAKRKYPTLNLSNGEYIISSVRRHPIGLVPIFIIVGVLLVAMFGSIPLYDSFRTGGSGNLPPTSIYTIIVGLLGLLVGIGGYIAVYVYVNNKFFLTNESVIQEIQTSLFARHEQTVSLQNIEDASYYQHGILPHLLNYGSIRLSTEGDETTYRFSYVSNPKKEISVLNNAVEAFKNGRPVVHD